MKEWWKKFFAVDNQINEQSVIGVFWTALTVVAIVLHVAGVEKVGMELVWTLGGTSLACFGIAGFKRP